MSMHINHRIIGIVIFLCLSYSVQAQYEMKPIKGYSNQIGIMVSMLEDLKLRITEQVDSLSIQETDFLFDENANSIGALIMHLAATESYYQVESLEERSWTDEEASYWEVPASLGEEARVKYNGKPIQYYLDIWNEVRAKTLLGLQSKNDEWFQSEIDDDVNHHWVWYHVMEHEANHMGQIALVKNRMDKEPDYRNYHAKIVEAEGLIAAERYTEALATYEDLFVNYPFIFRRDYLLSAQVALYLNEKEKAKKLLIQAIKGGYTAKFLGKNTFLTPLIKTMDLKAIEKEHENQREQNKILRSKVKELYSKDQKKALKAIFRLTSKAQDRYAEKKFAPHSEQQIKSFLAIMEEYGYPGEKLIGNEVWMSTILSHHNSISQNYNRKDTLYESYKPLLDKALRKGEISAFSYGLIDEWYRSVVNYEELPTYGILDPPSKGELERTNKRREGIYLRSIEVHNKLIELEEKTGMNFYLNGHPWSKEKINSL